MFLLSVNWLNNSELYLEQILYLQKYLKKQSMIQSLLQKLSKQIECKEKNKNWVAKRITYK